MSTLFKNVITESNVEPSMEDLESEVMGLAVLESRIGYLTTALESFDEEIGDTAMSVVDFSIESFAEIAGVQLSLSSLEEDAPEEEKKESRLDALKNLGKSIYESAAGLKDKLVKKFNDVMDFLKKKVMSKANGIISDLKKLDSSEEIETFTSHNDPLSALDDVKSPTDEWTVRLGNNSVSHSPESKPEFKTYENTRRGKQSVSEVIGVVEEFGKLIKATSKMSIKWQKIIARIYMNRAKGSGDHEQANAHLSVYYFYLALQGIGDIGVKYLNQVEKDIKAYKSSN